MHKPLSPRASAPSRRPRSSIVRVLPVSTRPSPRLLQALAPFGLAVSRKPSRPAPPPALRHLLRICRTTTGVIAITGVSGSGKSTLLRTLAPRLRTTRRRVLLVQSLSQRMPARTLADALKGPLPAALATLARCGLADATLLPRSAREMSDGQRTRLAIALALSHRAHVLLIDEFASVLDRITARAVCLSVAACMRRENRLLIVATAHTDVLAWLSPSVIVHCDTASITVEGTQHDRSQPRVIRAA